MTRERKRVAILDGYNVIHRMAEIEDRSPQGLEAARDDLLRFCREWMAVRRDIETFWVIFDGDSSVVGRIGEGGQGVIPVYTTSGETADERIIALVHRRSSDCRFLVVSDDNDVRRRTGVEGAEVQSVAEFRAVLHRMRRRRRPGGGADGGGKASLSPSQQRSINEELKRLWDL